MAIYTEEVVKPLPITQPDWVFAQNDEIIAYLNKYPRATVVTDYNGIKATINRRHGLYQLKIGGRTFMLNKTELRQFTMAR